MPEIMANPFVFVLGILVLTVVVPTITHYWYHVRNSELDASLKHDMLQRGMSAEEIAAVMEAPGRRCRKPAVSTEVTGFRERRA
jgi:hypothetical protein